LLTAFIMSRTIPKPPYTLLARYYDRLAGDAVAMNRRARRNFSERFSPALALSATSVAAPAPPPSTSPASPPLADRSRCHPEL
jgi:hypothetical protein